MYYEKRERYMYGAEVKKDRTERQIDRQIDREIESRQMMMIF